MTKPPRTEILAMTAVEADTNCNQPCLMAMKPLGGTKELSQGQRSVNRDRTDVTKEMVDRMVPSHKREYTVRELLPSDAELANAVPRMMVSV